MTPYTTQLPPVGGFDRASGGTAERLIFNHRRLILLISALITALLLYPAVHFSVSASYESSIPQSHPYIRNYLANQSELKGLGNSLSVVVSNPAGSIFDKAFLERMRDINDQLYLFPEVDRTGLKSIWTANLRWTEVTRDGYRGGPVLPNRFDASPARLEELKHNIERAGVIGSFVAKDLSSALIVVPLKGSSAADGGNALDYRALNQRLNALKTRFSADHGVDIHITGFARIMGELLSALNRIFICFAVSVLLVSALIFWYTRCWRSTFLLVACSCTAVVWQLGLAQWLGLGLDPYSLLVPFLVFAIGVSHGAQKMNGILQDIGRGCSQYVAARFTFRRLFMAGFAALAADAVGFAVLLTIDIPAIKALAMAASIGVAVLVLSNLILLPVILSYLGVSPAAARRAYVQDQRSHTHSSRVATWLTRLTQPANARRVLLATLVLGSAAYAISTRLQIGDLDPGAPELRGSSPYNQDNAYITAHYSLSSDPFSVIVKTATDGCQTFAPLVDADRLSDQLRQLPGVQSVQSLPLTLRRIIAGNNEGNPKWQSLPRNDALLGNAVATALISAPEALNRGCSVFPITASLADHKASTLQAVLGAVEGFARQHDSQQVQFLLAAGNAGVQAITNRVVESASRQMLFYVYGAVAVLCLVVFRQWRGVIIALAPLVLTSMGCEALMVLLGIGVKVATLPVIALGVGIGVDYALYLLSTQLTALQQGMPLAEAYAHALRSTGRIIVLVSLTLAVAVVTWVASPIKFQADMGLLLAFMFIWNMLGTLVLTPALSWLLLAPAARARQVPDLQPHG